MALHPRWRRREASQPTLNPQRALHLRRCGFYVFLFSLIFGRAPVADISWLAKIVTDHEPLLGVSTSTARTLTGGP